MEAIIDDWEDRLQAPHPQGRRAFGWDSVESSMRKTVSEWVPCTCIETQADENGKVRTKLYYLGGDESVPVYELNAIRCGVDSL